MTHIEMDEFQELKPKEEESGVRELIQKLDIKRREVLSLHYFEGLSVAEVGAALQIPEGTVKSRLLSARQELKELWQRNSK